MFTAFDPARNKINALHDLRPVRRAFFFVGFCSFLSVIFMPFRL
jgi:hypothetical protein